jgi:3-hydroxy-D-aspartate aldolase
MNEIGTLKQEMDTPALLIDLDLMEKNMSTMANFFRGKKSVLRPHTKIHKTPILAKKQITMGAKGICCQKVGAAEIMVSSGIQNVLITNVVGTPSKVDRLVKLSRAADITVEVDDPSNCELISKAALKEGTTVNVLVDVQIGCGRFGADPGEPSLSLVKQVRSLKGLQFKGVMGVDACLAGIEPRSERNIRIQNAEGSLVDTKRLIERSGIQVQEVSTGATGTYDVSGTTPEVTEVEAGSYLLMDSYYHEHVPEFECALTLLTTVISKHPEGNVVLDAGKASISSANGPPSLLPTETFDPNNFQFYRLHAENSLLKRKNQAKIEVGDKVQLIPSYLDATVVRHERFYGMRRDRVEEIFPIIGMNASTQ